MSFAGSCWLAFADIKCSPFGDDLTILDVNSSNFSFEEVNMSQHLTNGIDDMGQIEIACCYFVKHRGKQEEIVLFGGLYAALEFEKRRDPDFEVTLISRATSAFCRSDGSKSCSRRHTTVSALEDRRAATRVARGR